MLSQVLRVTLGGIYSYPNLTFNLPNIVNICQRRITSLNHSIEVNILWFQLVYDIEYLYSQSAPVFDLNRLGTVARVVLNINTRYFHNYASGGRGGCLTPKNATERAYSILPGVAYPDNTVRHYALDQK